MEDAEKHRKRRKPWFSSTSDAPSCSVSLLQLLRQGGRPLTKRCAAGFEAMFANSEMTHACCATDRWLTKDTACSTKRPEVSQRLVEGQIDS
jgi:hypothetical protein